MSEQEHDALMELPRMQFHLFAEWDVDPKVCERCGQLPQAHPSPEWLAAHPEEAR